MFVRLRDRRDDYLRFVTDPAVPFDNNASERTIRMPKLRVKVSGSMRTTTGAEHFAAIRSYTATAARHGIDTLDALIQPPPATPGSPPRPDPQPPPASAWSAVRAYPNQAPIQSHYEFANGKPLQLIDGSGLLAICQEYNIPARIVRISSR